MARCLRCGAGNEWIKGQAALEMPTTEELHERAEWCRKFLYVKGFITAAENQKARRRIKKEFIELGDSNPTGGKHDE